MTSATPTSFHGESARRKEDLRFVTGTGRYVGDIAVEGALAGVFVRSTVAHGTVDELDTTAATDRAGVVAVLTDDDLGVPAIPATRPPVAGMDRPVLASHRVLYSGEPMALVVARDPISAVDGAMSVWPFVDPLPVVTTADQALVASPIHPGASSNLVEEFTLGDPEADWDFPIVTTTTVENQRVTATPIEPLAAIAIPDGDGVRLTVAHQAPHLLKSQIGAAVDFPVEVVVPDVGGGFGQKARFYPEYVALVAAAHHLGVPIRWLQTRRENLIAGSHGRDMRYTVRLGGDHQGRIRRANIDITANVGAYPHIGGLIASFARLLAQEMYDIETFSIGSRTLVTNTAPIAPYRGAGRPQAAYGMERAIDDYARATGIEPAEVRRRNLIPATAFPHRTHTGALYDSGDYPATLDLAIELLHLDALRDEQRHRRAEGGSPLGVGFGAFVERAGGPVTSAEFGRVELAPGGRFVVQTGSTSNGQGHETVWAQLAAQPFDAGIDAVTVIAGDTTEIPRGTGSTASRSAQIGGAAIWRCSLRLAERCAAIAADLLGADEDLVHPLAGTFVDSTGRSVTLEEIRTRAAETGVELFEEEWYSPGAQTFPYGIHAAVVEVEVETGEVRLLRYVAVDDAGNILNPMIVEGQTIGSVAQGIGQAMSEAVQYDENGQLLTATLVDYRIPHAEDVPPIVTGRIVSPAPSNPLGAKGAAEGGTIGAPPAVVNAVLDALAPLGVTSIDMPLRPDRVWRAIQDARSEI